MRKKRKEDKDYISLHEKVCKHSTELWCPDISCQFDNKQTNSWFGINCFENNNICKPNFVFEEKKEDNKQQYKCIQIELLLSKEQKIIIHRWFNAYILMYNSTIKLIKERYNNNEKTILNYKRLRTYHLKDIKDEIIRKSQLPIIKDIKIKSHILDDAIKLACANYKSALSNLKQGNIRHFRIRKWKIIKEHNILGVETQYFTNGSLCPKVFGQIECYYNGEKFDLENIGKGKKYTSDCKVLFDRKTNKYTLLVPEKLVTQSIEIQKKSFVSLDPGIRTFMTGISENEVIKIGDNCQTRIKHLLKKRDKMNSYKTKNNKIRKKIYNVNYKLKNLVTDLHWKSINFLTSNYKTILIGDLSVKGISNKKTSNINKMTKRIGYALSFYKYRQRMQYKCIVNNCNLLVVNEKYTSKMCSNCGHYKEDLGRSKVYNCSKCKTIMDRDINGSRCICLKSIK